MLQQADHEDWQDDTDYTLDDCELTVPEGSPQIVFHLNKIPREENITTVASPESSLPNDNCQRSELAENGTTAQAGICDA